MKKFVAISFDVADAGILAGGASPETALCLLSPDQPALAQIADALAAAGHLFDELHIVAHGRPGALLLDGEALSVQTLAGLTGSLARIADHMTPDGVIALTACSVAEGAAGQELLAALSAATGRSVTGTEREVGGGDAASFSFAAAGSPASPFHASARQAYAATLAPPVFLFPAVELSDVEGGIGGFVINGAAAYDRSGFTVSMAGDINGDGLADVIVGANGGDPNGSESGTAYAVFGKADGTAVELSDVAAGIGGFAINGVSADDGAGNAVSSAGDVNGDGLDDLIVGAQMDDPNGNASGASFVVFGKSSGTAVELSDVEGGTGGFVINGVSANDAAGRSVSSAGDVNGDGLEDLIVGADGDDPNGGDSGASFVVFGKSDGSAVELSDIDAGTGGFAINGAAAYDRAGVSVSSAGDINGDGLDDVVVGAWSADPNGSYSGASFVVFGKSDGTSVELSDVNSGTGGFAINGSAAFNLAGFSVSGAGDVNGDGLDDVIVGAFAAEPNGAASGASYVVFGKSDGTTVELSDIEAGTGGFAINGVSANDQSGFSVSAAGDVNGDGLDDIIVGAYRDDPNGTDSGASFVVFGKSDGTAVALSDIEAGIGGFAARGVAMDDQAGISVSGAGDVNNDGLDDVVIGALGAAPNGTLSGASFVLFGKAAIDLLASSDTGSSSTDNVTGDRTPTIEFAAEAGVTVEIDWDDGNGFVAAASAGTGAAQQETLATPYTTNGAKDIQVRLTNGLNETTVETLQIQIVSLATPGDDVIDLSFSTMNEEIDGLAGDDIILTGTGDDILRGMAGDDILGGGPGADGHFGGSGNDTVTYFNASAGLTADLVIPSKNTGDAAGDTYSGIQNLIGSEFDDSLWSTFAANMIQGLGGDDQLFGRAGDDILSGNIGNDTLNGMDGNDTLNGQTGNDILDGGAGADMLLGGAGINTASYASATAGVRADLAAAGTNTGDAAGDSYNQIQNLIGSSFDDFLGGTAAANFLEGGDGNDTLWGRGGGDTSTGGAGDDQFFYQNGFGIETITDFEALNDQETISLIQVSNITDFADLAANHLTQVGADAVITDGTGQIILQNVQVSDLDVNDFVIVGLSAVDLIDASDTGASSTDDLTNDTTPTIEFITDPGVMVEVDWDDGNGFVPGSSGTGAAQQETLATDYATDGAKNIQVRATHTASGFVFNKSLAVTIDTATTVSAVDLIDASDTGISNLDDITGDSTPTIEFTAEAGAAVQIDWGDGNGFVAASGAGTGATQQETLAAAYTTNGVKSIQVQATDLAGNTDTQSLSIEIVGVGPDVFVAGNGDNTFFGYGGDDEFLIRFGNDTISGGDDADLFKFDGRYVNDGDAHTITDLDFSEGDTILFRFFDAGSFDDLADPGNPLQVSNGSRTATFDSVEDIVEAHLNGVLQVSDSGDGDTLITMPSAGNVMTVELDGLAFSSLNIPVDPSPTNDTLVGTGADDVLNGFGGDDLITMRFGDDTATGGTGGDRFILDGRYINNGDAHTITDLNFSEGDRIEMRFMDVDTFDNSLDPNNQFTVQANGTKGIFTTTDDLLEMALNGVITGADDGFGGTLLTGTVGGNMFTLTLDGIDIF